MTAQAYLQRQKYRRIEKAIKASTYVAGVGFTLPLTMQLCLIADADSAPAAVALTVGTHDYGSPAMLKGSVRQYPFFAKGQTAQAAAGYKLAVNIGLGRYFIIPGQ